MDLAVSIGNSNIQIAIRETDSIQSFMVPCEQVNEIAEMVLSGFKAGSLDAGVVASVNPRLTPVVFEILAPFVAGRLENVSLERGFALDYTPYSIEQLGIDRAICCEAAAGIVAPPFIMIDFGTATTINVVDSQGCFLGGMIIPGVSLGLETLGGHTALLPEISPKPDPQLIGTNTEECLQSGAVFGTALMVDNAVAEIWKQLGMTGQVVLTGGNAIFVKGMIRVPNTFIQDLAIEGLFTIKDRIWKIDRRDKNG